MTIHQKKPDAQLNASDGATARVQYGTKAALARSANGSTGMLCKSAVDGGYFFRVYGADRTFVDYELRHDDLEVTISPQALASFYEIDDTRILDHSPQVLGLKSI
jgi:hypothetical protein